MQELSPITLKMQRSLSRIGLAYSAFFAATYVALFLLSAVISLWAPHLLAYPLTDWLASMIPMYVFGLPAFILVIRPAEQREPPKKRMRLRHLLLFLLIAYAVMYLTNLIGTSINLITDLLTGTSSSTGALELIDGSPLLYTILFAVILGPLVEELMFRRLVLTRLLPYGERAAVLGSALFFALFHGNLSQIIYAFAVGAIFGYVYVSTGRLRYPALLHMLLNFFGSVIPLLVLRGIDTEVLDALAAATEPTGEMLAAAMPSILLFFGYIAVQFLLILGGCVLLLLHWRKLRLAPAADPIPKGERPHTLLSAGMLLMVLITLLSLIRSYL